MKCRFAIVALGVFLAACSSLAGVELSPAESRLAKKLYLSKCSKCHEFYNPGDYSEPDWRSWLQKMRKKSKLKPEQFDLLSRYLDGVRGEGGRAPGR